MGWSLESLSTQAVLQFYDMLGNGFQEDLAYRELLNGGLVQNVSLCVLAKQFRKSRWSKPSCT